MEVKLISVTPEAEKIIGYCARVSSPDNQENPDVSKLLKYLIKHKHWSPFELGHMTLEIETSRGLSAQLLRHSFKLQEFSQRYSKADLGFEVYEARRQDNKNKQNSIDDLPEETKTWFKETQEFINKYCQGRYEEALEKNIAKEQARFLLPLSTKTRMYVTNNIRGWLHYIESRTDISTQKEHRDLANACKDIFKQQFPITSEALGWNNV